MNDIYDSEIAQIQDVRDVLRARSTGRRNFQEFDQEIKDRFAEIGVKVTVNWHTAAGPDGIEIADTYIPEVTIEGRLDGRAFDPDRMVHEVTHDLLELGEGGVIDTTSMTAEQKATAAAHRH